MRSQFSIVIDSNEWAIGNHWKFPGYTVHVKSLLKVGCDYTVWGQRGIIGVERKAHGDYVRCCGVGWKAFLKQLTKLRKNKYYCVIVEGSLNDPIWHGSRMNHAALAHQTARILAMGISVLFADTPNRANFMCIRYMHEVLKRIRDET